MPRKASDELSVGFVALEGNLHVITLLSGTDLAENRKSRQHKRSAALLVQIYHPSRRTWRSLITKYPFNHPLDFKTAVTCTLCL